MKMAVFHDVVPCGVVDIDIHHPDDGGSKLISAYQTALCYIPEDSHDLI
jgi:hypothetical protein